MLYNVIYIITSRARREIPRLWAQTNKNGLQPQKFHRETLRHAPRPKSVVAERIRDTSNHGPISKYIWRNRGTGARRQVPICRAPPASVREVVGALNSRRSGGSLFMSQRNIANRNSVRDVDAALGRPRKSLDRLVIPVGHRGVAAFDLLVALAIIYSAVVEPIKVAYRSGWGDAMEPCLDALFWIDMSLQFVCAFEERGYPVLSLRRIARRYASTWFVVDLLAVTPWRLVSLGGLDAMSLIKTIRLLRLRRLLAHTKLLAGDNVLRVLVIIWVWLLIMHWNACMFFFLGWNLCGDGDGRYEETWVTAYFNGDEGARHLKGQGLPDLRQACGTDAIPGEHIAAIHVRAMYWALATMSSLGYGAAPVAVTNAELAFGIFCQVLTPFPFGRFYPQHKCLCSSL